MVLAAQFLKDKLIKFNLINDLFADSLINHMSDLKKKYILSDRLPPAGWYSWSLLPPSGRFSHGHTEKIAKKSI